MSNFKRSILSDENAQLTVSLLQQDLVTMLDLALQLKQAHWNVVGANFRSIHLQLDEIIDTVRMATDEVAERIVQIGNAPDGRAATIADSSKLPTYAREFVNVPQTVTAVADRLSITVNGLRESITRLAEADPISQDMLIGISASLEKHLWMVQSQEL